MVIGAFVGTYQIVHFKDYNNCPYKFPEWMISCWMDIFVVSLAAEMLDCNACILCGALLAAVGVLGYLVINPYLLVVLTMMQFQGTSKCIPSNFVFFNYTIIYFNNFLILIVGCVVSCYLVEQYRKNKRMKALQEK